MKSSVCLLVSRRCHNLGTAGTLEVECLCSFPCLAGVSFEVERSQTGPNHPKHEVEGMCIVVLPLQQNGNG